MRTHLSSGERDAAPKMNVLWFLRGCLQIIWASYHHYEIIIAPPGGNVTLRCVGPENVSASEWIKRESNNVIYSLLNRGEGQAVAENEFLPLEDLKLVDSDMKNNDVSAIFENLKMNATGIYECHIYNGTADPSITTSTYGTSPTLTFYVLVLEGGSGTSGTAFIIAASIIAAIIIAAIIIAAIVAVVFGVYAIFKRCRPNAEQNSTPQSSNGVNEDVYIAYRNQNGGEVRLLSHPPTDGEHN